MPIPNELILNNIRNAPYYNAYMEKVAKHDRKLAAKKEGNKKPATVKKPKQKPIKEKSSKPAPTPKPKVTEEKPLKPSPDKQPKRGKVQKLYKGKPSLQLIDKDEPTQPEHEPEPEHQGEGEEYDMERAIQMNAKKGAKSDKTNSEGDTEILQIAEKLGVDVDKQVNLEEKTVELDQDQAGSDPSETHESRPPPEQLMCTPNVQESLKFSTDEHVILEEPLSSSGTLSSIKNLDDAYTIGDQYINDKATEDEPEKLNVESEVVSMVTVLIYQESASVPPLFTPVIDISSPSKPASSTTQAPIFTATTTTTTSTLTPPLQQ
ncbi:hypothetical protein Tco_0985214 [Tanacetum coccineum]